MKNEQTALYLSNIEKIRKGTTLSKKQLCDKAGLSTQQYGNALRGDNSLGTEVLSRICAVLGVEIEFVKQKKLKTN